MATVWVILCLCWITAVISAPNDDQEARLRFYTRSINNYKELPLGESDTIISSSWYNPGLETVVFAHGFQGVPEGPAVQAIISTYLATGRHNVALLNWQHKAAARYPKVEASYAFWAAPNAITLGRRFSKVLLAMSSAGLDLNRTHLVGHSLGAQVFGVTGLTIKRSGISLPWITGLDPAKPLFERRRTSLTRSSATFVDILHTDSTKYGYQGSHGTVDYWPNRVPGGQSQPGCEGDNEEFFSSSDLCNHNRCWQLWCEAVSNPGSVLARLGGGGGGHIVLTMGLLPATVISGDYILTTNPKPPYGKGIHGI